MTVNGPSMRHKQECCNVLVKKVGSVKEVAPVGIADMLGLISTQK